MPEPVAPDNFDEDERWAPRFDHWWAFAVDPVTHRLEGNARAVFEAVRHDPAIRKVLIVEPRTRHASAAPTWSSVPDGDAGRPVLPAPGSGPSSSPGVRAPTSTTRCPGGATGSSGCAGHPAAVVRRGHPESAPRTATERHNEAVHDVDLTRAVVASSPAQARRPCASAAALAVAAQHLGDGLAADRPAAVPGGVPARRPARQAALLRRATSGPPARRLGPGARPGGRSLPALERRRPGLAASLGRAARRRGRRAPAGHAAGARDPCLAPWRDQRRGRPARALAPPSPRRRDGAAGRGAAGVRLQRPSCSTSRCSTGPSVGFVPDLDEVSRGTRAPPRPRRRGRRAGLPATAAELFDGLGEPARPSPRPSRSPSARACGTCCTPTGTGGAALRVVRRVQATYLPKAVVRRRTPEDALSRRRTGDGCVRPGASPTGRRCARTPGRPRAR